MESLYSEIALLKRCKVVLGNMAEENDRKWWQFWIPRWAISDEPLRGDAKNVLIEIDRTLGIK